MYTAKCIDHYTQLRVKQFEEESLSAAVAEESSGRDEEEEEEEEEEAEQQETNEVVIDTRLESIVNRMFERCLSDRRYKQAIGIAFETRRVDILQRAIHESVSRISTPNLLHTELV